MAKYFKKITIDECEVEIPLPDTIVTTECSKCGCWCTLGLEELYADGEIDLDADFICEDCTKEEN